MTDATNRKLDVDDIASEDIRRDDPLFELSQIIGFSGESDDRIADRKTDDAQIDLEDALLRELEGDDFAAGAEMPAVSVGDGDARESSDVDMAIEDASSQTDVHAPTAPSMETFSQSGSEVQNLEPAQLKADGSADVLEDELLALLGGLGEKTQVAPAWTSGTTDNEGERGDGSSDIPPFVSEQGEEAAERPSSNDREGYEPEQYEVSEWESDVVAGSDHSDVQTDADDLAIFDEFESALTSDLELSFHESTEPEAAVSAGTAVDEELNLELSELTDALDFGFDDMSDQRNDAPPLETSEIPAGGVEPMAPLDLPELPSVEKIRPEAEDIESELDAALAGFDNYDGRETEENKAGGIAFAPTAASVAAAQHLDIDMDAFEDDLARDFEYAQHDQIADEQEESSGPSASLGGSERAVDGERSRRGLVIAAIVGGVAILGAISAFGLSGGGTGGQDAPVLVKAETDPVKVVPDDPGGTKVPNQDRAVYGEVDGNAPDAPKQETLVSTSEEPIDLSDGGSSILPSGVSESVKVEDRLAPEPDGGQTMTARDNSGALAPRRVRTVVVKPDGTLVAKAPDPATQSPDPAPATLQTLPTASEASASVTEGNVRQVEAAEAPAQDASAALSTAASEAIAAATSNGNEPTASAPLAETSPIGTTDAPSTGELVASGEGLAPEEQPALAQAPQRFNAPGAIPERPAEQPVTIVNQPATQATAASQTEVARAPAVQTAPAAQASEYSVQIASLPSAALAQSTAANLKQRYSAVLGGRSINIQQAQIQGRGTFHRVRVAASSRNDAVALCERFKQAGGSCFVAR